MSTTFERIRFCAGAFAACAIQLAVPLVHGLVIDYQQSRPAAVQAERVTNKAIPVAAAAGSPRGFTL